jgi:hypothetical protein
MIGVRGTVHKIKSTASVSSRGCCAHQSSRTRHSYIYAGSRVTMFKN